MTGTIDPALFGMPNATNTGVPAGTTLTAYTGPMTITTPGTVIEGKIIDGQLAVEAANVTIKDCLIENYGYWGVDASYDAAAGNVTIENCTFRAASGVPTDAAIAASGTIIGNNISGSEKGINLTDGASVVKDNYIHDLNSIDPAAHLDGIFIGEENAGHVQIEHNTIQAWDTSDIIIKNDFGSINDVTVTNNLLLGDNNSNIKKGGPWYGGSPAYAVYVYGSGNATGTTTTNVSVTNNYIEKGLYGYIATDKASPTISGNIEWDNTTDATPYTSLAGISAPVITSFSPDSGIVGDSITNANKLDLKGTADPNSTITVYDGATQLGTTTASSTGSWDYITSVLTNAKHVLTATETNSSGQTSAASAALTVTVDTHVPAAPVLASDSLVNTNHVLLSGTAEANSTVTVYDGTTVVGTGTTNSSGNWSATTSALSSGTHALTATATDVAGTVSAMSQPLDPVIPAAPPSTPTPPAAPKITSFSTDSGAVGDHITNDNTPMLTGTAAANSTVKVFDGTTQIGTATADSSGHWTTLPTSALSDGTHNLTATDSNSSGISAPSAAFAVTIDTHAPGAPTMAAFSQAGAAVGQTTTLNDLVLKGVAEAGSTINVFDAGKAIGTATTNSAGAWSFDAGNLANGSHSFIANAIDAAGNTSSASATLAETVTTPTTPTSAPTASIDFLNVRENYSNHSTMINGTADAYSQVKLYDGTVSLGTVTASANGTWSFTTKTLSDTLHTIKAQEVDSSGHVIAASSGAVIVAGSQTSTLTGTGGDDYMISSTSHVNDTFVFAANFGHSTVEGFTAAGPGIDTIQFSKSVFDSFASVLSHASQVGQDVVISSGSETLKLLNTKLGALNSQDFHFA